MSHKSGNQHARNKEGNEQGKGGTKLALEAHKSQEN